MALAAAAAVAAVAYCVNWETWALNCSLAIAAIMERRTHMCFAFESHSHSHYSVSHSHYSVFRYSLCDWNYTYSFAIAPFAFANSVNAEPTSAVANFVNSHYSTPLEGYPSNLASHACAEAPLVT